MEKGDKAERRLGRLALQDTKVCTNGVNRAFRAKRCCKEAWRVYIKEDVVGRKADYIIGDRRQCLECFVGCAWERTSRSRSRSRILCFFPRPSHRRLAPSCISPLASRFSLGEMRLVIRGH